MNYLARLLARGEYHNPFFVLMGIEIEGHGDGWTQLSMNVRPDMLNGAGWLQGGLLAALADEAMALSLYTLIEEGERIATISESTSFLKGVSSGTLVASGRVVRKGRRVAFTEGEVLAESYKGTILSRSSASFAVLTSA